MTDITNALISAILDEERICISTELKWRCASYGIYHDDTSRVADSSPNVLAEDLSTLTYPDAQGKRIYKSKTNPPTDNDVQRKIQIYGQIVRAQKDQDTCGLFGQAVITLAFWNSVVTSRPIIHNLNENLVMSTRSVRHLQGTIPELDIYFMISRGHYGTDVKNKLEMQTPESTSKNKRLSEIIATWSANGIRPIIASPMSSKKLKSQLMQNGGRSFDYRNLILLRDHDTEEAFEELGMTTVKFMPGIVVDGATLNGKEFFAQVNRILERQISLDELLTHISYNHPDFSHLQAKSEGLLALLALQNMMEISVQHSSKSNAMKRAIEYLVYQYVNAATEPISLEILTRYVRSQQYLRSAAPLSKFSIDESKSVVSESVARLAQIGLVSQNPSGDVTGKFGQRPEEWLRIDRDRIKKDFAI